MKVWDPIVRLLHWTLAASIAAAWYTAARWNEAHTWIGYAALAVVILRLTWGFAGGRYARFHQFIQGPRQTMIYLSQVMRRSEPRHIGHNPLGGWMILALLACSVCVAFTGWLSITDAFWGYAWLQNLHTTLAWVLVGLIALHLAGVFFTSLRQRENLVLAMLTGCKRDPGEDDIH